MDASQQVCKMKSVLTGWRCEGEGVRCEGVRCEGVRG